MTTWYYKHTKTYSTEDETYYLSSLKDTAISVCDILSFILIRGMFLNFEVRALYKFVILNGV